MIDVQSRADRKKSARKISAFEPVTLNGVDLTPLFGVMVLIMLMYI